MASARDLPNNFHSHEYGGVIAPPWPVLFPAYTVLPFIRTPLGYELVRPAVTITRAFMLFFIPPILAWFYVAVGGRPSVNFGLRFLTIWFALAFLLFSLVIFARRWWGQRHNEKIHTGEAGYSWLVWKTSLPMPLCEQVLVPLGVVVLGIVVHDSFSTMLGWWLILCGISLFFMARWEHKRTWSQRRATTDDTLRAEAYEERIKAHERGDGSGKKKDGPDYADLK